MPEDKRAKGLRVLLGWSSMRERRSKQIARGSWQDDPVRAVQVSHQRTGKATPKFPGFAIIHGVIGTRRANHLVVFDSLCPAPFTKIFWFSERPNHFISAAVPFHSEGRSAIVTNAGWDAVDADVPLTNGT
jgi:hypothetical protein